VELALKTGLAATNLVYPALENREVEMTTSSLRIGV
jgi:hypothetical protein